MIRFLSGLIVAAAMFAQPIVAPEATAEQAKKRKPGLYATLVTSMGPITVKFYEKESPETVKNFVELATGAKPWKDPKSGVTKTNTPLYNGTIFHRVIPSFMIQGGDPQGTGSGNGGFTIPDEYDRSGLSFAVPGLMAMANSGPKSSSTQFFLTETPQEPLNGKHTIFGQVVDGFGLISKIARVPRDANDKPKTAVVLQEVQIYRVEKKK
jgi:peptidyl-prolyl cis-trans isomerase A (cyclophilin A)